MPQPSRSFKYKRRDPSTLQKRANAKGGDFDSVFKPEYKMYKPKDGKNIIRILPPTWDNAEHYAIDVHINYGIGADNQSYLSLSKMKGEADPIAEAMREAEKAGDKKLAKALKPNKRALMWVIDRNNPDEGPLLWSAPMMVDKSFANLAIDEDTGETIYIDDPEEGCDVRFYKEGEKLNTKYPGEKMKLLPKGPISQDQGEQDEWLEFINANPLPDVLQFYDYDHIALVFDGQVRTDEDETEETQPKATKPKLQEPADEPDATPPPRRRPAPVEDHDPETGELPPRRRPVVAKEPEPDPEPDETEPAPRPSIRDRLRARRPQTADED